MLWRSKVHYGFEQPEPVRVNLAGIKRLRLQVDGVDNNSSDHADWLNPVLSLTMNP